MNDMSQEQGTPSPEIKRTLSPNDSLKTAEKTVTSRLESFTSAIKKGVSKQLLLRASILSTVLFPSDNIQHQNVHAPNILEPTSVSAPLPDFTQNYGLETIQAPTVIESTETPTPEPPSISTPTPEPTPPPSPTPTLEPTPTNTPSPTENTTIQKEIKELESPADLIPEEELEERFGIKIFQLKGNIELGFRRGAEKDSLFQELEKNRDSKETYIVLVNGPYLDPQFLTAEQKTTLKDEADKEVIKSFTTGLLYAKEDARKWFEGKKHDKISEYYRLRHELESKQSVLSKERYEVEHQALEYQYAPFLKGPTDEDLINASEKTVGGNIGKYVKINGRQISRYYVFLAVKDMERTRKFKVGNEEIEVLKPGLETDISYQLNPDPSQSYPSPDSLTIDRAQPTYPIRKGWTPGIIARHELRHLRGSPHPQADLNLVSDIETAYRNYKNNGDDSGFWVVFKTPKGPVITEKRAPEAKNTSLT